jgi:hypothetical protein
LLQSTTASQISGSDIMLQGGGVTLVFNPSYNPGTNWTFYRIPLNEADGWRENSASGLPATQKDMLTALVSLGTLEIRAQFSSASDTDSLDDVRLLAPSCTPATMLAIQELTNNTAQLEWPTNACGFLLEASDNLSSSNWLANSLPVLTTNGFNSVALSFTNTSKFYRLVQQ